MLSLSFWLPLCAGIALGYRLKKLPNLEFNRTKEEDFQALLTTDRAKAAPSDRYMKYYWFDLPEFEGIVNRLLHLGFWREGPAFTNGKRVVLMEKRGSSWTAVLKSKRRSTTCWKPEVLTAEFFETLETV